VLTARAVPYCHVVAGLIAMPSMFACSCSFALQLAARMIIYKDVFKQREQL
jgi:hypothetical protein